MAKTQPPAAAEKKRDDDAPLFSRGGTTNGKCTAVLKTSVPEYIAEGFARLAREADCNSAELLRDLVCLAVHGQAYGELTAKYRRMLLGRSSSPEEKLRHDMDLRRREAEAFGIPFDEGLNP